MCVCKNLFSCASSCWRHTRTQGRSNAPERHNHPRGKLYRTTSSTVLRRNNRRFEVGTHLFGTSARWRFAVPPLFTPPKICSTSHFSTFVTEKRDTGRTERLVSLTLFIAVNRFRCDARKGHETCAWLWSLDTCRASSQCVRASAGGVNLILLMRKERQQLQSEVVTLSPR